MSRGDSLSRLPAGSKFAQAICPMLRAPALPAQWMFWGEAATSTRQRARSVGRGAKPPSELSVEDFVDDAADLLDVEGLGDVGDAGALQEGSGLAAQDVASDE